MTRGTRYTSSKSSAIRFLRSLSPLDRPEAKALPRDHPLRAMGYLWEVTYNIPAAQKPKEAD